MKNVLSPSSEKRMSRKPETTPSRKGVSAASPKAGQVLSMKLSGSVQQASQEPLIVASLAMHTRKGCLCCSRQLCRGHIRDLPKAWTLPHPLCCRQVDRKPRLLWQAS